MNTDEPNEARWRHVINEFEWLVDGNVPVSEAVRRLGYKTPDGVKSCYLKTGRPLHPKLVESSTEYRRRKKQQHAARCDK